MPDGIQVGDTATNPQTGKKIRWDGNSWQPVQSGIFQSALDELKSQAQGLTSMIPSKENVYGLANPGGPLATAFEGIDALRNWERRKEAGYGVPYRLLTGATEAAGIPTGARGMEEAAKEGNVRGVIGHALTPAAEAIAGSALHAPAERFAEKVLPTIERGAQNVVVSPSEIERARTEHEAKLSSLEDEYQKRVNEVGRKTSEDEAAYRTKVEHAKDEYARKVAENEAKKVAASAKETGAETRRKTLTQQPRSGPVYQRLKGMADQVGDSVTKLDKTVRAAYNARYNAFRQAMGDAEGNLEPVQQAIVDAQDTILKGSPENIAIFKNLLKEGEDPLLSQASVFKGASRGIDVKEVLSGLRSEGERNRFLKGLQAQDIPIEGPEPGPKEGATIPIDELQGYSTELGDKLYGSSSLSGDVRRALKYVKDAADKEIMRVADSRGQGAIKRQLDRDWAQYMGDFYDSDGALHKLKNAINSDSRISMLSGGEGSRVVEEMGNYARFDPQVGLVGRIRSLVKQLRELPSTPGTMPGDVERPSFPTRPKTRGVPESPDRTPFSSQAYRREHIEKLSENLSRITGWDVASIGYALRELAEGQAPWALGYPVGKRVLAKLLTKPGVVEYLSREIPNVSK